MTSHTLNCQSLIEGRSLKSSFRSSKMLDLKHNTNLRLAIGASKSSSVKTIYVTVNEPSPLANKKTNCIYISCKKKMKTNTESLASNNIKQIFKKY